MVEITCHISILRLYGVELHMCSVTYAYTYSTHTYTHAYAHALSPPRCPLSVFRVLYGNQNTAVSSHIRRKVVSGGCETVTAMTVSDLIMRREVGAPGILPPSMVACDKSLQAVKISGQIGMLLARKMIQDFFSLVIEARLGEDDLLDNPVHRSGQVTGVVQTKCDQTRAVLGVLQSHGRSVSSKYRIW